MWVQKQAELNLVSRNQSGSQFISVKLNLHKMPALVRGVEHSLALV